VAEIHIKKHFLQLGLAKVGFFSDAVIDFSQRIGA
jgi:hypothetical protein